MSGQDDPLVAQMVILIRANGNAERLLVEHAVEDGRCRSCSAGGNSSAKMRAPCTTYKAALLARRKGPLKK